MPKKSKQSKTQRILVRIQLLLSLTTLDLTMLTATVEVVLRIQEVVEDHHFLRQIREPTGNKAKDSLMVKLTLMRVEI